MKGLKLTKFLIQLLVVGLVIALQRLYPGKIAIQWFGYEVGLSVPLFLVFLVALLAGCIGAINLMKSIKSLPLAWKIRSQDRQRRKTQEALTKAFVALEAEDIAEVTFLTRNLLSQDGRDSGLAHWMVARAFANRHEIEQARQHAELITLPDDLIFIKYKDLANLAIAKKEWYSAYHALEKAYHERTYSPWIIEKFKLVRLRLLERGLTTSPLPSLDDALSKEQWARQSALEAWTEAESRGINDPEWYDLCIKAHKKAPSLLGPVLALADYWHRQGHRAKACKILTGVLTEFPHRMITEKWALMSEETSPLEKYRQVEPIFMPYNSQPEVLWSLAKLAAEAELWGQGQKFAQQLHRAYPSQESSEIVAFFDNHTRHSAGGSSSSYCVNPWTRPLAFWDPKWKCSKCHIDHIKWEAICESCSSVDTISWRYPEGIRSSIAKKI